MIRFSAEYEEAPLRRGTSGDEEDKKLIAYINKHGIWNWNEIPKAAGLSRSGRSCRLRWMNYLRPGIKLGNFSDEEEKTILNLHEKLGNCWSTIAAELPGRTDNDIKNCWNTRLRKRLRGEAAQTTKAQLTQASKSSIGTVQKKSLSEQETPLPKIFESSSSGSSKELPMPLESSPVNLPPMYINPTGEMSRNWPAMEEKNREEIDLGIPFEDQLLWKIRLAGSRSYFIRILPKMTLAIIRLIFSVKRTHFPYGWIVKLLFIFVVDRLYMVLFIRTWL